MRYSILSYGYYIFFFPAGQSVFGKLLFMGLVCVPLREKKPIMKKFTFISRKFHSIIVRTDNACLSSLLEGYEPAYTNFQAMSLSVKKTYTRAYFDAKTDAGREKRMAWIVERLHKNLKPM